MVNTTLEEKLAAVRARLAEAAAAKQAATAQIVAKQVEQVKAEQAALAKSNASSSADILARAKAKALERMAARTNGANLKPLDHIEVDTKTMPPEVAASLSADDKASVQVTKAQIDKAIANSKLDLETADKQEQAPRGKSDINFADLNEDQRLAVEYSDTGESFCLIGKAGTGKTTTTRCVATTLKESGRIVGLESGTKHMSVGMPSILFVSYTNVAVANIKSALPEEFKQCCMTIHTALEFVPEFYEDYNDEGQVVKKMEFVPTYGIGRESLPSNITHVVIEEGGSVPVWLYDELKAALPDDVVFIYLGDLDQLPPAFDDGILGYKLVEHEDKIVELKHVYRQALLSPIISLAHRILKGVPIKDNEMDKLAKDTDHGNLRLVRMAPGKDEGMMCKAIGSYFGDLVRKGDFVQGRDVVLCPFNVKFGTMELNKYIAQARAEIAGEPTYEVATQSGKSFNKHYLAVGDLVFYDRRRWLISDIRDNRLYVGHPTKLPSTNMDRWGDSKDGTPLAGGENGLHNILSLEVNDDSDEEIKLQSSHIITLTSFADDDDGYTVELSTTGDVNSMYLCNALTVHKAQGSEWKNVYFVLHSSHSVMYYRELLYTGTTRARFQLTIIYEGESPKKMSNSPFQKGVTTQKIKGNTLAAKLAYFKGKIKANEIKERLAMQKANGGKVLNATAVADDSWEVEVDDSYELDCNS